MAKDKITEYDATASNNTVCGDVNIAENSALPSDMNNFAREIMSHLKEGLGSGTPLYVDQTNNRLGINSSSPATALDVDGTATVNRLSTDGTIIDLQKDGTSVGKIGNSATDDFYIGASTASHSGLYFGTNIVYPMTANSLSDGATSLGHSSNRFNNLYLSGGAYLGGTGSANYLDDYEEGTFTPTWNGYASPYSTSGKYVKVGNQVTVYAKLVTNSGSDASSVGITNLPFTISGDLGAGSVYHNAINLFSKGLVTVFNSNSTTCFLETESGSSQVRVTYVGSNPQLGGFGTLIWVIHYQTI